MSRISHYKKCWECGAEASHECIGEDGKPALEVCDGRVLKVPGDVGPQSQRNVPSRRDAVVPDAVRKSRGHRSHVVAPTMVPCDYCGTATRLWGAAHIAGKTWCAAPACQTVRKRAKWARERATRRGRQPATPHKARQCVICAAPVPAHGVRANREAACPGACREARWRQMLTAENERRRARREASPARVPCEWCGISLPGGGRRPGQRACCGSPVCTRARATAARRGRGVPERTYRQPAMSVTAPPVACSWCEAPTPSHPRRSHAAYVCCGDLICDREIKLARARAKRRQEAVICGHEHSA